MANPLEGQSAACCGRSCRRATQFWLRPQAAPLSQGIGVTSSPIAAEARIPEHLSRQGGQGCKLNLLAGRAQTLGMHPLTAAEMGQAFDLRRPLEAGNLPSSQTAPDLESSRAYLKSYVALQPGILCTAPGDGIVTHAELANGKPARGSSKLTPALNAAGGGATISDGGSSQVGGGGPLSSRSTRARPQYPSDRPHAAAAVCPR